MDQHSIEHALTDLPLGAIRYYASIGSTNDAAAKWADQGAPDLALVIADEQTAGRGRSGRRWYTPPGSGLAFSLVLHTQRGDSIALQQLTALGSLAVQRTLKERYSLPAQIKWPNDVLIGRSKVAGVLAEMHWIGDKPVRAILGIGINIAPQSIDQTLYDDYLANLPATCVQDEAGKPVDRLEVLHEVLRELLVWRSRLGSTAFTRAWEAGLAFRDEWVSILEDSMDGYNAGTEYPRPVQEGKILGLADNGGLILRSRSGEIVNLHSEQLHVRPVKDANPGT
jgi:BirA family biotin operon repressor/biotin-[acetyl-CoA-carboxylase] ligase